MSTAPDPFAQIQQMSDEEKRALAAAIRRRITVQAQDSPGLQTDEQGRTLAIPQMPLMRPEHLDPSTTPGKGNLAMLMATGLAGPARAIAGGLSRGGLVGGLGEAAPVVKTTLAGGAIGGALGMTPLPVVGGKGFSEGAKMGAMFGAGQGGMGALWKHGKKKALIDWLIRKATGRAPGGGLIDEVASGGGSLAPGASATASSADDIARAVEAERQAAAAARALPRTPGGASTTLPTQAAPAPAPAAPPAAAPPVAAPPAPAPWPPQSAMTFQGAAQRGGRKALDAALEAGGAKPPRSTFGSPIGSYEPGVAAGTGPTNPLVLKVQQAMTQPGGREAVMQWLQTQPREIAEQILPLLKQGASSLPTTF